MNSLETLTIPEACELTRIPRRTMYHLIERRMIPVMRVPGMALRMYFSDLERFMNAARDGGEAWPENDVATMLSPFPPFLPRLFVLAGPTETTPLFCDSGVRWRELMAAFAVRLAGIFSAEASPAQPIDPHCHRLQVVGVDAAPIAAQMVESHPIRNWPLDQFICDSMGRTEVPFQHQSPIPVARGASPLHALVRHQVYAIPKVVFDRTGIAEPLDDVIGIDMKLA